MITSHYLNLSASPDWHTVVDDFGDALKPFENNGTRALAWASAYRFANGQTFEQAGYRSIGAVVAEH